MSLSLSGAPGATGPAGGALVVTGDAPKTRRASIILTEELHDREDALIVAFHNHRKNIGGILLEKELEAMLLHMSQSDSHLYHTTEKQVKEFLWAQMNALDDDEEEAEDDEEGDAEVEALVQLGKVYNKMVESCLTIARLKRNHLERTGQLTAQGRVKGGAKRSSRRSAAFQGTIGSEGGVGDTGRELGGYANEEEASQAFFKSTEGLKKPSAAMRALFGDGFDKVAVDMSAPGTPPSSHPGSAAQSPAGHDRRAAGQQGLPPGSDGLPQGGAGKEPLPGASKEPLPGAEKEPLPSGPWKAPLPGAGAAPAIKLERLTEASAGGRDSSDDDMPPGPDLGDKGAFSGSMQVASRGLPAEEGAPAGPVENAKGKKGGYRRRRLTNLDRRGQADADDAQAAATGAPAVAAAGSGGGGGGGGDDDDDDDDLDDAEGMAQAAAAAEAARQAGAEAQAAAASARE